MRARGRRRAGLWTFVLVATLGAVFVSQTPAFASFPGQKAWSQRYQGLAAQNDGGTDVVANPIENLVYVTGYTTRSTVDYATIAYDAVTGKKVWSKSYDGPGAGVDSAVALAVSQDGAHVYVTGSSPGTTNVDYATVAYNALNGKQEWAARYDGGAGDDYARDIGLSPDGSLVYVTGRSAGTTKNDYATVAYDAATGAQLGAIRYDSGKDYESPGGLAVGADGRVFVTGYSDIFSKEKSVTLAYDAALGHQLWAVSYHHKGGNGDETDTIGVSPDGTRVYVTGATADPGLGQYLTIAYDASNGHRLWLRTYTSGDGGIADALAVSPDGYVVYVSGESGVVGDVDYATVAYDTLTGDRIWARIYAGPGGGYDRAYDLALSPSGTEVYVTGASLLAPPDDNDYATVAYDASTGAQEWAKRYNGYGREDAYALAMSPDGLKLYVTGFGQSLAGDLDFVTIAYYTH